MQNFDVLDRATNIHRHHLLEASAGTGKTFSIENIVVRLLIENNPLRSEPATIDKILVVTFTRAATHDLKVRIRTNIQKALAFLNKEDAKDVPDFLKLHMEQDHETRIKAKRRLEQALFCFDEASIYTIHSFCSRALRDHLFEGDVGFDSTIDEDGLALQKVIVVIRDFFRSETHPDKYSPEQLRIVLNEYSGDIEKLEAGIAKVITKSAVIEHPVYFKDLLRQFQDKMLNLKQSLSLCEQEIIDDYALLRPAYTKGKLKESDEIIQIKVKNFAKLFNKATWDAADFDRLLADQLVLIDALDQPKKKAAIPSKENLNYPDLISRLRTELYPIIEQGSCRNSIFAAMAYDCRQILVRYLYEEEKLGPDDLLETMLKSLENPAFAAKVQGSFCAAIIDEFQDTDPIQWSIFHKLFMTNWQHGLLYLVGDPKQSIYSFRQADIYTYLEAGKSIGEQHHASLKVNHRSQPLLVEALNILFENTPGMIPLPKHNSHLKYPRVESSARASEKNFNDGWGCVHFFIGEGKQGRSRKWPSDDIEETLFFPFITQELLKLNQQENIDLHSCAILVRDRFQGERLASYLKQWNIPTINQRQESLSESRAILALIEILSGILHPKDNSALRTALGGELIGFTSDQIIQFQHLSDIPNGIENIYSLFYGLRKKLLNGGFAEFFYAFMNTRWHEDKAMSVREQLLCRDNGIGFYSDLQQIADIVIDHQNKSQDSPEQLIQFLYKLSSSEFDEDERLKKRFDSHLDAVQILTLHASKGLEFDIVFALGLANRNRLREKVIPSLNDPQILIPLSEKNQDAYSHFLTEQDAEKMRLLYVGMTRAKYRLYVPVAIASDHLNVSKGTASPVELFLARLNQPFEEMHIYERISNLDEQNLIGFIDGNNSNAYMSYSKTTSSEFKLGSLSDAESPHLYEPKCINVPGKPQYLYAFSSLSKVTGTVYVPSEAPHDYFTQNRSSHTLPSGSETGIILHKIFETLPFQNLTSIVAPKDLLPIIISNLKSTQLEGWEAIVSEIVFHTLKTRLNSGEEQFSLCDVNLSNSYREMEFLYPWERSLVLEDLEYSSGLLKGVIDLVFEHLGKYYIIDWKSNWLGNDVSDYAPLKLDECMKANNYYLQATIYKEALRRYLKIVDPRPFEECFGGIFYLFVRGMRLDQGPKAGVQFFL